MRGVAERVRYALSGYEEFRMLRQVETDPDARIVRVTYDRRRCALKNIEWMIAAYGFDAGGTPATPEAAARLPETCE